MKGGDIMYRYRVSWITEEGRRNGYSDFVCDTVYEAVAQAEELLKNYDVINISCMRLRVEPTTTP